MRELIEYMFGKKVNADYILKIMELLSPNNIGEFSADTKIAYDYWQEMNETGKNLVKKYGKGAGKDIDNYYHPLLQCQLAKIDSMSQQNGILLGYMKEVWDYINKTKQGYKQKDIIADSRKDLKNNKYGSTLGEIGLGLSCMELLNDRRTDNMRKENIR